MTSAYELVADTRPRVRRDLLFTRTPDGVLFHNAQGGFRMTAPTAYRFASLLVPYFNGDNQVEQICAPLGPEQRAMVGSLVQALYDHDFARDVPVGNDDADLPTAVALRFAAQIAYVDHYADAAATRFTRFRDTRVAVLGTGPIARWCASSLVRNGCALLGVVPGGGGLDETRREAAALANNGCPVEIVDLVDPGRTWDWTALAGYDVVVVAGGADAARQTLHLLEQGIPEGTTLLPAWTLGSRAIVGPLSEAETAGCWACAALRLSVNGNSGVAADLWQAISLTGSVPDVEQPTGALAAMLGNLLGYEVYRLTTGALPAETRGKVIIQNLESLDVLSEALLPHPGCTYCADPAPADDQAELRSLLPALRTPVAERAETTSVDVQADAESVLAELTDRMVLVGRHAGVFTDFTDEAWVQIPLKVSTVRLALGHTREREIAAFDVHHIAGARRRALHAAAGVYADHVRARIVDRGPAGTPRVDPAMLGIASGIAGNATVPGPWTTATSLLTGDVRQVPMAAVRPFGPENDARMFVPTRAGTGAGASLAAAVEQGILSALSYAALLRAIRGLARITPVGPATADGDAELTFLVKSAANLGAEIELLDLGAATTGSAHVLLARTVDPSAAPVWRVAGHPDRARAAVESLRDLLGAVQLRQQDPDRQFVDDGDALLTDFDAGTLRPNAEAPVGPAATGSLATVLDSVRAAGQDALAVVTTPSDLRIGGIATVRVLLTGPDVG
ncbi:TOMM precursor leader peptide-binding protein [Cryptosporangium minutisporangium]